MRRRTYFFISFLIFVLFAPLCVLGDSNNINSLIFATDPQTISTDSLSGPLKIETTNNSGTAEFVSETNYITLTTTSATGQFFTNTSRNPVAGKNLYISSGDASRSFYYQDSTSGTYIITVTAIGRTSGKTFSATQTIVVTGTSSDSSSDNSTASSTDNSTASSTSNTSSNGSDSSAAYSSQEVLYEGPDNEPFNISIGRNRLVMAGEQVIFNVKLIPESVSFSGMLFHWAFGDGTEWNGISATHTYEYPGNYIVVVSASRYGDEAVAEAKIKVVTPNVAISNATSDSVVITNNGDDEINLGGWVVADAQGRFTVPQDTIIASHSSVTVPAQVMKTRKFVGEVTLGNSSVSKTVAAPVGTGAAARDMSVVLPSGIGVADFQKIFTEKFSEALAKESAAAPSFAKSLRETKSSEVSSNASVQSSSSPEITGNMASSSAAAVIYTIPRGSADHFFSGVTSWIGNLFGKK